MTKEELEKEAEEYTNKLLEDWELYDPEALQEAYIAGAEPSEKRIAELKAQIEKMKCGQNCKHSYLYQEDRKCKFTYCDCINCKDKWELRS